MMLIETFIDFVAKSYSKRNVLILLGLLVTCIAAFIIISIYLGVGEQIGDTSSRVQLLDIIFNYSQKDVVQQFEAYGPDGIQVCLFSTLVLDSIFPLVYGALAGLLLSHLLYGTPYKWLVLLPLLIVVVDYLENTHTALLLINFPKINPTTVFWGSLFTSIKWGLIGVFFMVVSFGFFLQNRARIRMEMEQDQYLF